MTRNVKMEALTALGEFHNEYPNYEIVYAAISGSQSFGWNDKFSDIDVRGCYQIPTKMFFDDFDENLPNTIEFKSKEYDVEFQMHEIKKFTNLMIKPNLNILDCVFVDSSLILEKDERYSVLTELGNDSLSKECYPHVQGLTTHMKKHRNKYNLYDPKKNLYIYRELLRGIVLFESGKLINNISDLVVELPEYAPVVNMLLKKKYNKEFLSDDDKKLVEEKERELETRMLSAKEFGILPDSAPDNLKKRTKRFVLNERKKNYDIDKI